MNVEIKSIQLVLFLFITLSFAGCCVANRIFCKRDPNIIYIKVHKSVTLPDSDEITRDSLIAGGLKIGYKAQRYYEKGIEMSGGSNSFLGFVMPVELAVTDYGYYSTDITKNTIRITGIGRSVGYDQINPMKIEVIVTPQHISGIFIN